MYKNGKDSMLLQEKTSKKPSGNQSHLYSLLSEIPYEKRLSPHQQSIITKSIELNLNKEIEEIANKLTKQPLPCKSSVTK